MDSREPKRKQQDVHGYKTLDVKKTKKNIQCSPGTWSAVKKLLDLLVFASRIKLDAHGP